jgi:hypothetical protein
MRCPSCKHDSREHSNVGCMVHLHKRGDDSRTGWNYCPCMLMTDQIESAQGVHLLTVIRKLRRTLKLAAKMISESQHDSYFSTTYQWNKWNEQIDKVLEETKNV